MAAPTPDEILNKTGVKSGSIEDITARGIRGLFYTGFLFVISVLTGFINIIQQYLRAIAGGVGATIANFLGGIAAIIRSGAISTANNFLLPGPFGFVEALAWTFVGLLILSLAMDYFDTDIFGLPGAAIIPFYGESAEEDDG